MTWPTDRPGYPWLKPCPFCGSEAQILSGDGKFCVACCGADCFCFVGEGYDNSAMPDHVFVTEEDAADAWNRRAPTDLDAAVQAEREACADVAYHIYDDRMTVGEEESAQGAYDAAVSIQARGPTPALDAALAQARREGMLAAAREWFTAIRQDVTRMDDEAGWHFDVDSSFPPVSDELGSLLDAMEPPA